MAQPLIQSTGSLSGAGTAGEGRNDLQIGETVTLTDTVPGNTGLLHNWEFIDLPIGSSAALNDPQVEAPTFSPDVTGTYWVRCTVGSQNSEILIAVPLANSGARIPAFEEQLEYNESLNAKGWHQAQTEFMRGADAQLGGGGGEQAKVSANDTTAGYLNGKLVAGANITLNEQNDGGNETLQIVGADEAAKVSANDTTPGFLNGKLVAGANIVLTEQNDAGDETLSISSSSGTSQRVAPDANDLLVWKMNEQTGDYSSTGSETGAQSNMVPGVSITAGYRRQIGLHGNRSFYSEANGVGYGALSGNGGSITPSGTNLTVEGWFNLQSAVGIGLDWIFVKHYDGSGSTWVAPFYAIAFFLESGTNRIQVAVRTSPSTTNTVLAPGIHLITPKEQWIHMGITYDESTLNFYMNGVLIDSNTTGGAIDWGSNGPWRMNGNNLFSGEFVNGIQYYDWRVAEVVRPASYFQQVWASKNGTE